MSVPSENARLIQDDSEIQIWVPNNFDITYAPQPAKKLRDWMESDAKSTDHAKFCQPITMAASLGFYIPSPVEATIKWNGKNNSDTEIICHNKASHGQISNHSAHGSFTVQTNFYARTKNVGDFIMISDIINEVRRPYNFLGACIEGWWNVAHFGLVAFLNQPGEFKISLGQPLVQIFVLKASGANADIRLLRGSHPHHEEFKCKRSRIDDYKNWDSRCPVQKYKGKDLDYLNGRYPDLQKAEGHQRAWKRKVIPLDFSE